MTEYLITANEEWVPDYSEERMQEMSQAVKALRAEMKAAGVYVFLGGLDNSAPVFSVDARRQPDRVWLIARVPVESVERARRSLDSDRR